MQLTRRDWLKSTLFLTAGVTLTSGIASKLMAAPVSRAEEEFLKTYKPRTVEDSRQFQFQNHSLSTDFG